MRGPGCTVHVHLDAVTEDPAWFAWSSAALADQASRAVLVLDPIVYAGVSAQFARVEDLERALPDDIYERETLPWEAAFLAGKAFLEDRRRGGARRSPLPDFYIGAHALVRGYTLLTRDAARYRTYFPRLGVVAADAPGS